LTQIPVELADVISDVAIHATPPERKDAGLDQRRATPEIFKL